MREDPVPAEPEPFRCITNQQATVRRPGSGEPLIAKVENLLGSIMPVRHLRHSLNLVARAYERPLPWTVRVGKDDERDLHKLVGVETTRASRTTRQITRWIRAVIAAPMAMNST